MHDLVKFFRANPQVFLLLVICVVLGIGTFVVVMIGVAASGSTTTTGYPDGAILGLHSVGALHLIGS